VRKTVPYRDSIPERPTRRKSLYQLLHPDTQSNKDVLEYSETGNSVGTMTRLRTILEFSESINSEGRVTKSQDVLEYSESSDSGRLTKSQAVLKYSESSASGRVTRLRNVLECSELINSLDRVTRLTDC
jgi:hypothetical protein